MHHLLVIGGTSLDLLHFNGHSAHSAGGAGMYTAMAARCRGVDVSLEAIVADIHARDERDSSRAAAPLKPAKDALLLDTGNLTIGGAVQAAIALVEDKLRQR